MTGLRAPPLVVVSHGDCPAEAQDVVLHLAQTIRAELDHDVECVILGAAANLDEFRAVCAAHLVPDADGHEQAIRDVAHRLRCRGAEAAIVASVEAGDCVAPFREAGFRVVALVPGIRGTLRSDDALRRAEAIAAHAHAVVFPNRGVEAEFTGLAEPPVGQVVIRPRWLDRPSISHAAGRGTDWRAALRARFGCPPDAPIVVGAGAPDARAGFDLFIDSAVRVCQQHATAIFIWVGERIESLLPAAWERWAWSGSWHRIHVSGCVDPVELNMIRGGADLFLSTSRDAEASSALLNALDAGLAVIAFASSRGAADLLATGGGWLVPAEDSAAMARETLHLLDDAESRSLMSGADRAQIRALGSFRRYACDVAALALPMRPRVSVVVPNYNYGRYLEKRLSSITHQSYPVYELIVLDDASTDDSVEIAARFLDGLAIDHELVCRTENGGSVFRQWLAGVERARGDLVWIAEADDLSDPRFLEALVPDFADPNVVMAYCESRRIDADGAVAAANYDDYVADVGGERWQRLHAVPGQVALQTFLSVKNTIPNVSACLFRRDVLHEALRENIDQIAGYRIAGDWATYAHVLSRGSLAFFPVARNDHRRHAACVTVGAYAADLLREILTMQRWIRLRHSPPDDWRRRAREYAQEFYVAFGLATDTAPLVSQHPDFAEYWPPDP